MDEAGVARARRDRRQASAALAVGGRDDGDGTVVLALRRKDDLTGSQRRQCQLGRVVADAMCTALPCLVFDTTALPEIGDTLLLCNPANPKAVSKKFEMLVTDECARASIGRQQYDEAVRLTREHRGDIAEALWHTMESR